MSKSGTICYQQLLQGTQYVAIFNVHILVQQTISNIVFAAVSMITKDKRIKTIGKRYHGAKVRIAKQATCI